MRFSSAVLVSIAIFFLSKKTVNIVVLSQIIKNLYIKYKPPYTRINFRAYNIFTIFYAKIVSMHLKTFDLARAFQFAKY